MLSAEVQAKILSLHYGSHWTLRAIARELNVEARGSVREQNQEESEERGGALH